MATYWKSQPKHHCDFCKCWIADNRPSIDFHERGKRHKENVEKKLKDLRQKGQEQYKMQLTLDQDLIKMEQDAIKAFKKDLANDPALAAEYRAKAAAAEASEAAAAKQKEALLQKARQLHKQGLAAKTQPGQPNSSSTQKVTDPKTSQAVESESDDISSTVETATQCVWLEGTSPEGDTYYWNTVTGESQWEKPEDYLATAESTAFKNQGVEDAINETTEQGDGESNDKQDTSESDEEQDTSESDEEQQTVVTDSEAAKASKELLPPGTEAEQSEESDSDEEKEEEPETTQRPAKRKMNPYGSWATIIPDNTPPVDLQLPKPDRPYFQPVVPQAAQFQPRERIKFKERTVTTLSTSSASSSSSGQTSFKKRKFGGGGRSIRQRETDT